MNWFKSRSKSNNLLSSSTVGLGIKAINTMLLFAINIFVARELGEEGYTQFSLLLTVISIGIVVFQFGFPNFIIRSEKFNNKIESNEFQSFHVYLAGLGLATVLLLVATLLYYFYVVDNEKIFSNLTPSLIIKASVISYFGACILLTNAYLRAKGQVLMTITVDQLLVPLLVLVGISTLFASSLLSLNNIIHVYLVMNIIGCIALLLWIKRNAFYEKITQKKIENVLVKADVYLSMFTFSLCFILLNHIPILILGISEFTESIAVFRVGYLLALPLLLIAYPVNILAAPYISKAFNNKEYFNLSNQLRPVVKLISLLGFIYSLIVLFLAEFILKEIFKFEDTGFQLLVFVILLNNLISIAFGPVGLVLNIIEKEKYVLIILVMAVIASTLIMSVLVNQIGVIGLAIVSTVTTCLWKYILLAKVKREIGIDCSVLAKKRVSY